MLSSFPCEAAGRIEALRGFPDEVAEEGGELARFRAPANPAIFDDAPLDEEPAGHPTPNDA